MEIENVVSSRQPIENLNLEENPEFSVLFEKFDMFREVLSPDLKISIKFSYLEHLLRLSTNLEDTETGTKRLPEPVKSKVRNLIGSRPQMLQGVIHALDTIIGMGDLVLITPEIVNFNYIWTGMKLNCQRSDYGKQNFLPISYSFSFKNKVYILYTQNMTYIDGFDPYTGSTKIPILTVQMLKGMSKEFYIKANHSVEIQTDGPKKQIAKSIQSSKSRSSVKSGNKGIGLEASEMKKIVKEETAAENPEFSPRDEEAKNEEVGDEGNSQELEDIESVEEDLEEDDDEPSQSSFETGLDRQLPAERTWEKYQKRALERQKERDQCGPGDCII